MQVYKGVPNTQLLARTYLSTSIYSPSSGFVWSIGQNLIQSPDDLLVSRYRHLSSYRALIHTSPCTRWVWASLKPQATSGVDGLGIEQTSTLSETRAFMEILILIPRGAKPKAKAMPEAMCCAVSWRSTSQAFPSISRLSGRGRAPICIKLRVSPKHTAFATMG